MTKLLGILSCVFIFALVGSAQAQTLPTKSAGRNIGGHKTWSTDTVYVVTSNVVAADLDRDGDQDLAVAKVLRANCVIRTTV